MTNMTHDIKDVEIFRTGTWNGDKYTENDFDAMVSAHSEIGDKIKPFMKLGHAKNQKLLQADGYPAAGWIQNLRRAGDRLLCDITGIPGKINELIGKKAYGRFSPEILWGYDSEENGKKYPRVLMSVALLGGDTPACTTMDDFINLYGIDAPVLAYEKKNDEVRSYHDIDTAKETTEAQKPKQEAQIMDPKLQELTDKVTTYEKTAGEKDQQITAKNAEIAELKTYREKIENEKHQMEIDAFIKANPEKISPAQEHFYRALLSRDLCSIKEYAIKDGEREVAVDMTTLGLLKKIVENAPKFVSYSQDSGASAQDKRDDEDKMIDAAKKYAKDNGVSFKTAVLAVNTKKED